MTLLIKNVRILGGAREFPDPCDVFVSGDKISAIGNFVNKKADETIDGQSAYLSPGFIDVNTDSDHYLTLFEYPSQEDFLRQGVTTIFGGMCGSSLAPLLYGTLESVRKWSGSEGTLNVDWHTMAEFLMTIDKRPFAINFGTLAGHSTIRRSIVGDALRDLTKNELGVFIKTLQESLEEGGFGLSTGLGYVHAQKTPYSELKTLAQAVKKVNGIYATHLRNTSAGIGASVDETIKLAKETGVKVLMNHFVPLRGAEQEYQQALEKIEQLPNDIDLHFDIYPFNSLLLPFYTFLPDWVRTGGFEVMLANIQEGWLMPKIKNEMDEIDGDRFVIAQAPDNDFLIGKTLSQLQEMYGLKDSREALLKLMTTTRMRGVALYENLNAELMKKAIVSKRALIASNAPSFSEKSSGRQLKSERTTQTFSRFLELVERDKIMPLADAIRRITLEPAQLFDLKGRGEIKEGNYADLACWKNGEVKFTIVNGKVVVKEGEFQNNFPGKALRHGSA
jgi:N-acyl-D-amino-acid deacylase